MKVLRELLIIEELCAELVSVNRTAGEQYKNTALSLKL